MNAVLLGGGPLALLGVPVVGLVAGRRVRARLAGDQPVFESPPMSTLALVRNRIALALTLIAFAAALNVPAALALQEHHSGPNRISAGGPLQKSLRLQGAAAAARGWPSSFPPGDPWPAPNFVVRFARFGATALNVSAGPSAGATRGFVMDVVQFGWPLRVIEDKGMGWDTNAPGMQRSDFHPPPALLTPALILNPLIFGGGAFVLLLLPLTLARITRARRWRRRGRCLSCGYDVGPLPICPECGRPIEGRESQSV